MINPLQLLNSLRRRIVLKVVSKRKMINLRKKILLFEEEFVSADKIPMKRAREYIRMCIKEECSDILEDKKINKIVIHKEKHLELFNIWNI